jgi:AraC-like DNA-binding protein
MYHFAKHFGLFVGALPATIFHKHYAMQISLAGEGALILTIKNQVATSGTFFYIASGVEHKLESEGVQLTILINPLSTLGHCLSQVWHSVNNSDGFTLLKNELELCFNLLIANPITAEQFYARVSQALHNAQCICETHEILKDSRILKALSILEANMDKPYPLSNIARECFVSPSRFLHLFKETTGFNFRRYQLWNKLVNSLPFLMQNSIAETATQFGFTDSSHYIRTCKQTFGVGPNFLLAKH